MTTISLIVICNLRRAWPGDLNIYHIYFFNTFCTLGGGKKCYKVSLHFTCIFTSQFSPPPDFFLWLDAVHAKKKVLKFLSYLLMMILKVSSFLTMKKNLQPSPPMSTRSWFLSFFCNLQISHFILFSIASTRRTMTIVKIPVTKKINPPRTTTTARRAPSFLANVVSLSERKLWLLNLTMITCKFLYFSFLCNFLTSSSTAKSLLPLYQLLSKWLVGRSA